MNDQDNGSERDERPADSSSSQDQQAPRTTPRGSSGDETWGQGSATALQRLRERNYGGRRSRSTSGPSTN